MSQTMYKPTYTPPIHGRCKASTSQNQRQHLSFPIAHGRRCLRLKSSPLVVKGQQAAVCRVGVLERPKVKPLLDIVVVTECAVQAREGLRTTSLKFFEFAVGGELDGGGGGDDGNNDNRGGGSGGGDDDDYINDDDDHDSDDDHDDKILDRETVDAILKEWQMTFMDLPPRLRQAYEMGRVSSSQLVKFLAMSKATTITRLLSLLPRELRDLVGGVIANPALLHRLFLEQILTTSCSIWWEVARRKGRINEEWDLALINVWKASVCNAVVFAGSMLTLTSGNPAEVIGHRLIRGLNKSSVNYFDVVRVTLLVSMSFRCLNAVLGVSRPNSITATTQKAQRMKNRHEDCYA